MTKIFQWKKNTPCKANGDDGDSLLWAGLLYSVSQNVSDKVKYRSGIVDSIDVSGRFWRSPDRVGSVRPNSFSRDMAVGLLLAASRDKVDNHSFGVDGYYLEKWISYVKANGNKLCPDATDTRGVMTIPMWWRVAYVRPDIVSWHYRYTRWFLKPYLYLAAETCKPGYHRHLIACTLLMLYVLNGKRETWGWLKATASKLNEDEPKNPFFMWLDLEDDESRARLKEIDINYPLSDSRGTQWAWERTDSEEAYRNSCGHDREFMELLWRAYIK